MQDPDIFAGDSHEASRRRLLRGLFTGLGSAVLGAEACAQGGHGSLSQSASQVRGAPGLPRPIRDSGYRLVRNWDFGRTVTDHEKLRGEFFTRYIYDQGRLDALNDEWQRYRDSDNHVFDGDGLSLVARAPAELASGLIESGMLRSRWSGQYGYFECRMKVPAGRGLWPAFWLNPQDAIWPPEIDVVEVVNNGRDTTRDSFHFVHPGVPNDRPATYSRLGSNHAFRPGFDYKDDFHTFAVDWTAERVRHFVDDVLIVDRPFRWLHSSGADGGSAHVLVNLAVGGKWPGPPARRDDFPAKLQLKHIRVWQR